MGLLGVCCSLIGIRGGLVGVVSVVGFWLWMFWLDWGIVWGLLLVLVAFARLGV